MEFVFMCTGTSLAGAGLVYLFRKSGVYSPDTIYRKVRIFMSVLCLLFIGPSVSYFLYAGHFPGSYDFVMAMAVAVMLMPLDVALHNKNKKPVYVGEYPLGGYVKESIFGAPLYIVVWLLAKFAEIGLIMEATACLDNGLICDILILWWFFYSVTEAVYLCVRYVRRVAAYRAAKKSGREK